MSRYPFLAATTLLLYSLTSLSVNAQTPDAGPLEEVVVTGSYLYTGIDSPSPVSVVDGEDIMVEAPHDLMQFFFSNVPQNYSGDTGAQTGSNSQPRLRGGGRSSNLNLRGIGDENTLTVLNGRRTIPSVIDGQGWPTVDINSMVPRIAIGRAEILLDGGSALFGSDPVAGVVNFITRNDFRGFDFSLDTKINETVPDAKNYTFGALWGAGDDETSGILSVEFMQSDRINIYDIELKGDTDPDVTPEFGTGLGNLSGLNFDAPGMGTWVDPDCGNPAIGAPILAGYPSYNDGDFDREADNRWVNAPGSNAAIECSWPSGFNPGMAVQHDMSQIVLFASGTHRFSDLLTAGIEINYGRTRIEEMDLMGDNLARSWAKPPMVLGADYAIPATHPGLLRAQALDPKFGKEIVSMGMAMAYNGAIYQEGETLPYGVGTTLPHMPSFNRYDLFRAALTLEGSIPNSVWAWKADVSAAYNQMDNALRDMLLQNYPLAINGWGGPDCGVTDITAANNPTPGTGNCEYYNPFMSNAVPESQGGIQTSAELLEWLVPNRLDTFHTEFVSADFLVTGEVGNLPGGPIGVAAGVAYRKQTQSRDSDAMSNLAMLATVGTFNDWAGSISVDSIFGELALPVTDTVNVQLAVRNESYALGFAETTPKIAVNWTANDDLTVRASYGTSFRGPSVVHAHASQIIQGMGMRFVNQAGSMYGMGGGLSFLYEIRNSQEVTPQTADSFSLGFDWDFADNHSFGGSWTAYDFKNRIVTPTAPTVMMGEACLSRGADGLPTIHQGDIVYVPVSQGGCGIAYDASQPITYPNLAKTVGMVQNVGGLQAEFLDLRANFNWDTAYGSISISPQAAFTLKYLFDNSFKGAGVETLCPDYMCNGIGRDIGATTGMGGSFNGVTSMPHWQGNIPLTWNINGDHTVRLNANYRDGLNAQIEDLNTAELETFNHEEGLWTVNANYIYNFGNGSLNFFVQNLMATEPPATNGNRFFRRLREYGVQFRWGFDN
ncbi:MAG: TonB-dependent receptor plug domain-containing protein [Candidatus Rariloculaceae bacterium]